MDLRPLDWISGAEKTIGFPDDLDVTEDGLRDIVDVWRGNDVFAVVRSTSYEPVPEG